MHLIVDTMRGSVCQQQHEDVQLRWMNGLASVNDSRTTKLLRSATSDDCSKIFELSRAKFDYQNHPAMLILARDITD